MARDNRVQTRMEDEPAERVEQYADDHNLSHSEAVRELVKAGLDYKEGRVTLTDGGQMKQDLDEIKASLNIKYASIIETVGILVALPVVVLALLGVVNTESALAVGIPVVGLAAVSTYLRWS